MTPLAAYLLLFTAVGVGFIFVHLVLGKLIRPARPHAEKETIYECGEETIGSAWIQFDLRFYVVALLFVIFDVEVVFFFPWAEVFGKANAIVAAPAPTTAAEYNEVANRVLDLAVPEAETDVGGVKKRNQYQVWQKLRDLTPEQLAAFKQLRPDQVSLLRPMTDTAFQALRGLKPAQMRVVRQQGEAVMGTLAAIRKEQEEAASRLVPALAARAKEAEAVARKGAAPGQMLTIALLRQSLPRDREQQENNLQVLPLGDLGRQKPAGFNLLALEAGWIPAVRQVAPDQHRAIAELADRHHRRVLDQANAALAALAAAGPDQEPLWRTLSASQLALFGSFSEEQFQAVTALSPATLAALVGPLVPDTRAEASSLAWLALVELLFFFGILLVGYAYLWRRGDLTWVRSLAAEEGKARPAVVASADPHQIDLGVVAERS
ncbi:MAG: NADH-quinone oxidoreductase subunit A [Gemmataceae bacterium]